MPAEPLVTLTSSRLYSTDADGGAPVSVCMRISGTFGRHYLEFVAGRAAWLSLAGSIELQSEHLAVVVAAGPEALVGALEMACILGPSDALVETIETRPETRAVPLGFIVRR